ncbi:MAG: hypothetical protein ACFFAJ_08940 [Candidatus Hodarchaeota archaeon]
MILQQTKNVLVFTIAVRDAKFSKTSYFLEEYLQLIEQYSHVTFCVVAGHPAYSSIDVRIPLSQSFDKILAQIRNKTNKTLYLGVDNLSSGFIGQIRENYGSIIPFLLHGDSRAICSNGILPPFAVYSPIIFSIPNDEIMNNLKDYLLRRKSTQKALTYKGFPLADLSHHWLKLSPEVQSILYLSFQDHVLNPKNFHAKIQAFTQQGAHLIVGNPIASEYFNDLVKGFNLTQVKLVS